MTNVYNGGIQLYIVELRVSSNILLHVGKLQQVYTLLCGIFKGACLVEASGYLGYTSSDVDQFFIKGDLLFTIRFVPECAVLWLNTSDNKISLCEVGFDIWIQQSVPVCKLNRLK